MLIKIKMTYIRLMKNVEQRKACCYYDLTIQYTSSRLIVDVKNSNISQK